MEGKTGAYGRLRDVATTIGERACDRDLHGGQWVMLKVRVGTITPGQAKTISSRAVEKATQGRCRRQDIRRQLDGQFKAPDHALLRGVKDARKVTDAIVNSVKRGGKF